MSKSIDLGRLLRIAKKREELGEESLTEDERAFHDQCMTALRPVFEKLSDTLKDPRWQEGYAAWEQMTPEEQEKYEDWTPVQLQAFLPLIEDESGDEEIY